MGTDTTPVQIENYEVIREIGRGGMGFVYLCRDSELDRVVALKVMRQDKTKNSRPNDRQRFIREAVTTARLQHPGIPPVFSVRRTHDNQIYYAMKMIDGRPLDEILKALKTEDPATVEHFTNHRLVDILREVCKTLSYAHAKGFIHRDLKPSNIFVGDFGEVYVIDWGLTKKIDVLALPDRALDDEESTILESISDQDTQEYLQRKKIIRPPEDDDSLTLQGDMLGTPAYMPPEQTIRNHELTIQADVYALGVILYRMLTLSLPVDARNLKSLVIAKREGKLLHPDQVAPDRDIPPELAAIAMQAMATQPDDRFDSVSEFSQALEFWLDGSSQFRRVDLVEFSPDNLLVLPKESFHHWSISDQVIKAGLSQDRRSGTTRLFLNQSFSGDLRLSLNLRVLTPPTKGEVLQPFGIIFRSSHPDPEQTIDHYRLHLAENNNNRLSLTKNESEIASNENHVFEPNKKNHLVIESTKEGIRVTVNSRLVLSCPDHSPLTGGWIGFQHQGQPVIYSKLMVMTRGLPLKTDTIAIPETLMAEGSFRAAQRHFLDIFHNHRHRYIGSWACYRAGVASFRKNQSRKQAMTILSQLLNTRQKELVNLGLARIELLEGRPMEAALQIENILEGTPPNILLRSVADFTHEHIQNLLRDINEHDWAVIDRWIKLTLLLDRRLERQDSLSIPLLWRWFSLTMTEHPDHLNGCISYFREVYGGGRGEFGKLITNEQQLSRLVQRTLQMKNHSFLLEKLMRLILWHEDPIEDLETLGRFYLSSGHEKIALQIFQQLITICTNAGITVPSAPAIYVSVYLWIHGSYDEGRRYLKAMTRNCKSWGPSDAYFFLGLDDYRRGRRLNAVNRWKAIQIKSQQVMPHRHGIASALLGEASYDPIEAGVPDRHDYRLLFNLFVGLRFYLDWKEGGDQNCRTAATELLKEAHGLQNPSYDIYSSSEFFLRQPLEEMGAPLGGRPAPENLGEDEKAWLKDLIFTIKAEVQEKKTNP